MERSIKANPESWGDFEVQLGRFTQEVAPDEFSGSFNFFRSFLYEHLRKQELRIEALSNKGLEPYASKFNAGCKDLFRDGLRPAARARLDGLVSRQNWNWATDFVVFNYTTLVDSLVRECVRNPSIHLTQDGYQRSLNAPLHIHGDITDGHGLLVGVNDGGQIVGAPCRASRRIQDVLVKPRANERSGDLRESRAKRLIDSADVVAVYGMSLGESDRMWWSYLADWLAAGGRRILILCALAPSEYLHLPEIIPDEIDRRQHEFFEVAQVDEERRAALGDRILVSLGSADFDLDVKSGL